MLTKKLIWDEIGVTAEASFFIPVTAEGETRSDACVECHVMLHVEARDELFDMQFDRLCQAERLLNQQPELKEAKAVFKRFFLSDATNQVPVMEAARRQEADDTICAGDYAISIIQQPPLDGSKIALWIYYQKGTSISRTHDVIVAEHNGYQHLYKWGMQATSGDSYCQTRTLLEDYEQGLRHFGATIEANCIRTWFFVRDVDTQYAGMVKARKDNFDSEGLTQQTHYISSTGIGGLPADPRAIVQLGAYALLGFEPRQQHYLYAPSHLNPTYEYGVTFERGTVVEYGDRAEIYISGTASIDNRGEVLHVGDIVGQTRRMWENVEALLAEGNASAADIAQIIVYLRDMGDYSIVRQMFENQYPGIPCVITLAPVCRPTWLIEMECIAIARRDNPEYRNF